MAIPREFIPELIDVARRASTLVGSDRATISKLRRDANKLMRKIENDDHPHTGDSEFCDICGHSIIGHD